MTIEEVITIAKMLRPDFVTFSVYGFDSEKAHRLLYDHETFFGDSWEEALREAGWKGLEENRNGNCLNCGIPCNDRDLVAAYYWCNTCLNNYWDKYENEKTTV